MAVGKRVGRICELMFCPQCPRESRMRYAKQSGPLERWYDQKAGRVIHWSEIGSKIIREWHYCPSCKTVVWYDVRINAGRRPTKEEIQVALRNVTF